MIIPYFEGYIFPHPIKIIYQLFFLNRHYCVDWNFRWFSSFPLTARFHSPIPVFPFSQYSSFTFTVSQERWIAITCDSKKLHLHISSCRDSSCVSALLCCSLYRVRKCYLFVKTKIILKPVMHVKLSTERKAILRSNTPFNASYSKRFVQLRIPHPYHN
jgi:hypothetical protein